MEKEFPSASQNKEESLLARSKTVGLLLTFASAMQGIISQEQPEAAAQEPQGIEHQEKDPVLERMKKLPKEQLYKSLDGDSYKDRVRSQIAFLERGMDQIYTEGISPTDLPYLQEKLAQIASITDAAEKTRYAEVEWRLEQLISSLQRESRYLKIKGSRYQLAEGESPRTESTRAFITDLRERTGQQLVPYFIRDDMENPVTLTNEIDKKNLWEVLASVRTKSGFALVPSTTMNGHMNVLTRDLEREHPYTKAIDKALYAEYNYPAYDNDQYGTVSFNHEPSSHLESWEITTIQQKTSEGREDVISDDNSFPLKKGGVKDGLPLYVADAVKEGETLALTLHGKIVVSPNAFLDVSAEDTGASISEDGRTLRYKHMLSHGKEDFHIVTADVVFRDDELNHQEQSKLFGERFGCIAFDEAGHVLKLNNIDMDTSDEKGGSSISWGFLGAQPHRLRFSIPTDQMYEREVQLAFDEFPLRTPPPKKDGEKHVDDLDALFE